MEYRQLGRSGLRVSTITLGTMGFGGTGWASPVGHIDVEGARKQIGLARDAGVNLFDTADVYSSGLSEEILGAAIKGKRERLLISTKATFTTGDAYDRVLDFYRGLARRAGCSAEHQVRGGDQVLGGTDGDAAYYLIVTPTRAGSEVALIVNNGR